MNTITKLNSKGGRTKMFTSTSLLMGPFKKNVRPEGGEGGNEKKN